MTITAGNWIEDITMGSQVVKCDRKNLIYPQSLPCQQHPCADESHFQSTAPSMMWIKKDYLLDGGIIPIERPDIMSCVGYEEATIHQQEGQ